MSTQNNESFIIDKILSDDNCYYFYFNDILIRKICKRKRDTKVEKNEMITLGCYDISPYRSSYHKNNAIRNKKRIADILKKHNYQAVISDGKIKNLRSFNLSKVKILDSFVDISEYVVIDKSMKVIKAWISGGGLYKAFCQKFSYSGILTTTYYEMQKFKKEPVGCCHNSDTINNINKKI